MNISEITDESALYDRAVSLRQKLFFEEFNLPITVTCD